MDARETPDIPIPAPIAQYLGAYRSHPISILGG
jgi:hypothetical protein